MANAIGYEELGVGSQAVGPTASLVSGGVACAVFLVDSKAAGSVRWKPNAYLAADYPSAHAGFPLSPGKWISVAGEGSIRNSKFILDGETDAQSVKVHVLYFDRVDVVAADFAPNVSTNNEAHQKRMEEVLNDILIELRKHTDALSQGVEDTLESTDGA